MPHPLFTHPTGEQCIWLDGVDGAVGYWFVPLDAGGEGHECRLEHPDPSSRELELLDTFVRALDRRELDRTSLYALEPWRLATMAKLAYRCGVMTRGERDEVVRQVQVGIRPVRIPVAYR